MEEYIKKLYADERESIMRLEMVENVLRKELPTLNERLGHVEGGRRDYALISKKCTQLKHKIMHTVPEYQIDGLKRNMASCSYAIGARMPGQIGKASYDTWGTWVSWGMLNEILDALHDHCMMCDKDLGDQGACPLRKALDELPNDVRERTDGGCQYRGNV